MFTSPYFCRKHGEPLRYAPIVASWRCPEYEVCGTEVHLEYQARTAPKPLPMEWWREENAHLLAAPVTKIVVDEATFAKIEAELARPPRVNTRLREMVLRSRAREKESN